MQFNFRQNADVFKTKSGAFRSAMKKYADFGKYKMQDLFTTLNYVE